jgi:TrpR-related protein YerC/YecD
MTGKRVATSTEAGGATGEDRWMTESARDLAAAIAALRDEDEALRFLRDLCTVTELREFAARWEVARLLDEGLSYHEISERTGASSATISRVNQWLRYGRDGYRLLLDRRAATTQRGSSRTSR